MTRYLVTYEVMPGDIGLIVEHATYIDVHAGDAWTVINAEVHKVHARAKVISYIMDDEDDLSIIADYFC